MVEGRQLDLFDNVKSQIPQNKLLENVCRKLFWCGYFIPKEIPLKMPDGLCERMPKILIKDGKRLRYGYPRISTMEQCPIMAEEKRCRIGG